MTDMRHIFRLTLVLLVSLLGQDAHAGEKNAADLYERAWESLCDEDRDRIERLAESGDAWLDDDETRAWLDDLRPTVELIRNVRSFDRCDFAVDVTKEGLDSEYCYIEMPLLMSDLCRLDAMAEMREGNEEDASRSIASMFVIADHIAQQPMIISSVVAGSVASDASETIMRCFDRGELTAEMAARIREVSTEIAGTVVLHDFQFWSRLAGEGRDLAAWLRDDLRGLDDVARAKRLREIAEPGDGGDAQENFQRLLEATRTAEGLESEIQLFEKYYEDVYDTRLVEDSQQAMKRINERAGEGEYGTLSYFLIPDARKAHAMCFRASLSFFETNEMLRALAEGGVIGEPE